MLGAHTRFDDTGSVDPSVRARGFRAGEVEWIAGEGSVAEELAEDRRRRLEEALQKNIR